MDEARATAMRLWGQFRDWYTRAGRGARIGVAVGALIVVCGCCAVSVQALGGGKSGASSTPTANLAAHQATATTKPTATHTPAPTATTITGVTTATLGGPELAFVATYGTPILSASEVRDYRVTIQGEAAGLVTMLNAASDSSRVRYIQVAAADSSTSWSNSQAEAIAKTFLPPDAVYQKDINAPNFGTEHIYTSALLAASLPASAFQDVQSGNAVAPGTFYLACGDQTDGQGKCSMQPGE